MHNMKKSALYIKYCIHILYTQVEIRDTIEIRAVKIGWNPWVNPAHHGSGQVGLKFFYKFQYGLIIDPAHVEPGSPGLNPWWDGLVDKRVKQVFY